MSKRFTGQKFACSTATQHMMGMCGDNVRFPGSVAIQKNLSVASKKFNVDGITGDLNLTGNMTLKGNNEIRFMAKTSGFGLGGDDWMKGNMRVYGADTDSTKINISIAKADGTFDDRLSVSRVRTNIKGNLDLTSSDAKLCIGTACIDEVVLNKVLARFVPGRPSRRVQKETNTDKKDDAARRTARRDAIIAARRDAMRAARRAAQKNDTDKKDDTESKATG